MLCPAPGRGASIFGVPTMNSYVKTGLIAIVAVALVARIPMASALVFGK